MYKTLQTHILIRTRTYQAIIIQTHCHYPELDVLGFLNHPHICGEHEVVVATSGHLELNLRGQIKFSSAVDSE